MRISIGHVSRYVYSEPTKYSILALRLTPPSFQGQRVIEWRVSAPGVDAVKPFRDGFGNLVHLASCTEEHSESLVIAKGVVDTEDRAGIVRGLADPAPLRVYRRQTPKTTATDEIRALDRAAGAKPDIRGCTILCTPSVMPSIIRLAPRTHTTTGRRSLEGRQGASVRITPMCLSRPRGLLVFRHVT